MELLAHKPQALEARHLPDSVAIKCDCKTYFLWVKRAGNKVTCPACLATAELKVNEAPAIDTKDPYKEQ